MMPIPFNETRVWDFVKSSFKELGIDELESQKFVLPHNNNNPADDTVIISLRATGDPGASEGREVVFIGDETKPKDYSDILKVIQSHRIPLVYGLWQLAPYKKVFAIGKFSPQQRGDLENINVVNTGLTLQFIEPEGNLSLEQTLAEILGD
jgi:hypothetical protein